MTTLSDSVPGNTVLQELGRRLAARRQEAHLSTASLASRAAVARGEIEAFEAGQGGLAANALTRLARALGVPEGSFLHVAAPEIRAHREPSFMLREATQGAMLSASDRTALTHQLYRARAFAELGEMLGKKSLAKSFQPRPPKIKPYNSGYDLAHTVRKLIGDEREPLRNFRVCLEDDFNILVVPHRFEDPRISAATCRSGDARLIAISPLVTFEPAQRIVLGHELAHQLADLGEDDVIADSDHTENAFSLQRPPVEQRASAFSIMLLASHRALSTTIGRRKISWGEAPRVVSECRAKFGVGFQAMTWHLYHLKFFDFSEEQAEELAHDDDGLDVVGFETPSTSDPLQDRINVALRDHIISEGRARILSRDTAA
jgi:transcriptional regulator with XRE-family HTH domain